MSEDKIKQALERAFEAGFKIGRATMQQEITGKIGVRVLSEEEFKCLLEQISMQPS